LLHIALSCFFEGPWGSEKILKGRGKELVVLGIPPIFGKDPGVVSLTYLSILKKGFKPIFSATLNYGKSVSP